MTSIALPSHPEAAPAGRALVHALAFIAATTAVEPWVGMAGLMFPTFALLAAGSPRRDECEE